MFAKKSKLNITDSGETYTKCKTNEKIISSVFMVHRERREESFEPFTLGEALKMWQEGI